MAEKNGIKKSISLYIGSIRNKIPIQQVVLFGSHAQGKAGEQSDIDLAIFSPRFSDKTHLKDVQLLWTEAARIDSRIEPLPFSTSEAKKIDPRSFLAEILRSGKVVYKKS